MWHSSHTVDESFFCGTLIQKTSFGSIEMFIWAAISWFKILSSWSNWQVSQHVLIQCSGSILSANFSSSLGFECVNCNHCSHEKVQWRLCAIKFYITKQYVYYIFSYFKNRKISKSGIHLVKWYQWGIKIQTHTFLEINALSISQAFAPFWWRKPSNDPSIHCLQNDQKL